MPCCGGDDVVMTTMDEGVEDKADVIDITRRDPVVDVETWKGVARKNR